MMMMHRRTVFCFVFLQLFLLIVRSKAFAFQQHSATVANRATGSLKHPSLSERSRLWNKKNRRRRNKQSFQTAFLKKKQELTWSFSSSALGSSNNERSSRREESITTREEEEEEPQQSPTQKKWVLLVDDEESIRNAVGQLLFDRGFEVTTCADAPTTLQLLERQQQQRRQIMDEEDDGTMMDISSWEEKNDDRPMQTETRTTLSSSDHRRLPDVIVSDIRMPGGMDGLELLEVLRSDPRLVQIPVILLTAKGMTQDRIQGYNAGADAYLSKPFDPDELVAMVDSVICKYDILNSPSTTTIGGGKRSRKIVANNNNNSANVGSSNSLVEELQRDLQEIKNLLLENGIASTNGPSAASASSNSIFLAPDERNVLELLCEGLTNKEIAQETFSSTRRVEQVLTSLFRKINVRNRTELVRWAISSGWVQI